MSRTWCPPSRRGHAWRELLTSEGTPITDVDPRAVRVCKRCGTLGCVSRQGVIHAVEPGS